jgi:hypothetical protein
MLGSWREHSTDIEQIKNITAAVLWMREPGSQDRKPSQERTTLNICFVHGTGARSARLVDPLQSRRIVLRSLFFID